MVLFKACFLGALLGVNAAAAPSPTGINNRSCSAASFANTTDFILREYTIETVPSGSLGTFAIENPGTGDVYRLYRVPVSTGGGTWSVCRAGDEAPLPSVLARCQYLIERWTGGRIGFRFQWYCDDKDPSKPLLFDATVIGELPNEVCVTGNATAGVSRSCGLPDAEPVLLSVANISWEPTPTEAEPTD
ncbi:hypothetical protein B0H63DRAFT_543600 [Podospora didyma]|uniref:AA1-like domain-containing protein n=1 Tax=Podospora didyma TaxID=330526 RepID=A0AAE0NPG1_9PEZI|nr:hypothetical protein B0H63DRAFT_543600 [Podospora didyma]